MKIIAIVQHRELSKTVHTQPRYLPLFDQWILHFPYDLILEDLIEQSASPGRTVGMKDGRDLPVADLGF